MSPNVCFEVEEIHDLSNWRSVVAWGAATELTGPDADHGMQLLIEHVLPKLPPGSAGAHPSPSGSRPVAASVYQILISESTGRFESQSKAPPS